MTDGDLARQRRANQFEHYLALMEHRTVRLAKADCFLVFSVPARREVRRRIGDSTARLVQFAFMDSGFYLDLPDTTLTPEEAKLAIADRTGFRFALENEQKRLGERECDPVQRHYTYAEKQAAALDAAYVFFDLWSVPVHAWIKVEAAAFDSARRWERGFSMG